MSFIRKIKKAQYRKSDDRKNIKEIKKDNKINIFANAGASLIVQKYNARPVRYEGPGKISLSPLLIDIPFKENI